ncbi:MAG: helix-turn-helix transcriptional regulator [Sphingobium sp.]|nr:helix-turn-helix transcriptional regulator [Sphingobium sp.]MCP5399594.1 helix-turn-helix transcriptional regulator [Sphingomonas sp.]
MQRGWVVSTEYRSIIEKVKAVRLSLDVSQRELARRLGKPPSFVNKIELLERRMDILEFVQIAEALGMSAEQLIAAVATSLKKE